MEPYDRFHQLLKRDFFPLLRADGFKGSGTTFRRVKGDRIDVVVSKARATGASAASILGFISSSCRPWAVVASRTRGS